jgi:hypothetical protein
LIDGVNSLIYDRSESVAGIVRALHRLDDQAFRAGLIERAADQAAEEWTSRTMADAYLRLYVNAVASTEMLSFPRFRDSMTRATWRAALAARPAWGRARRFVRG